MEKFGSLESQLSAEKGDFTFFALFMREGVDVWDLIVAAPWLGNNRRSAADYLIGEIESRLGKQALTYLSRIVPVDPENTALQSLTSSIAVEHGDVELRDRDLFGQTVREAHIITSKRPPALTPA